MKKIVLSLLISLTLGYSYAATRSTDNLRNYQTNLDILADKSNNLLELIGELQGFTVIRSTVDGGGSRIVDSRVTEGDTVINAVVLSSANVSLSTAGTIVGASMGGNQSALIIVRSKIAGTFGNQLQIVFTQHVTSNAVLSVNTTGYTTEVKLSSAGIFNLENSTNSALYATAARVCAAIQAYAPSNDIMTCETSHSTRQVIASQQMYFAGGVGSVLQSNVISGSHFTVYDGYIAVANDAPIEKSDTLILFVYRRPQD